MARQITVEILGEAKHFTKATEEAIGSVSKLTGAIGAATGVLAAFGIGIAGAFALKSAIDKTEQLGEEVFRMTKIFGLSAESASKWLYVAQATGVNAESLQKSFKILAKNLETLQLKLDTTHKLGLNPFTEEMKRLGVQVTDKQGKLRDFQAILLDTADAFQKLGPAADLAGHATIVFGKGGVDLIPILQLGKQGILDLENEAQKYGLVISTDNLPKIHAYIEAHRHLDAAMQGMQLTIGQALIPILTDLTGKVTDAFQAVRGWIEKNPAVIKSLQNLGEAGIGFVSRMIEGLILVISGPQGAKKDLDDLGGKAQMAALATGSGKDSLASAITTMANKLSDFLNSKSTANFLKFWQNVADLIGFISRTLDKGFHNPYMDKMPQSTGAPNNTATTNPFLNLFKPHAMGLDYVPYDNYPALLHKGEEVRPAGRRSGGVTINLYATIADGPALDRFTNDIAQRLRWASGV